MLNQDILCVEFGTWVETASSVYSDYREFVNIVLKLECKAFENNLTGAEVFVFTDNTTMESGSNMEPLQVRLCLISFYK